MDELPVELLAQIVEYCDYAARKQLRCTTKTFHDLTTPLVFHQVYVAAFKHSLAKFTSLAASHLATHVRQAVFLSDTLPLYTKVRKRASWTQMREIKLTFASYQAQWQESIDMRPEFRQWREQYAHIYPDEPRGADIVKALDGIYARARDDYNMFPRHQFTEQELETGWQAYRRYYRDQDSWKDYREAWKFQSAFCKLPNVQEAIVATAMFQDRDFNSWPFWRRFYAETFVGPDCWKDGYPIGESEDPLLFEITEKAVLCLYEAMARHDEQGSSPVTKLKVQHIMKNASTLVSDWRRGPRQPADLLRNSHVQAPQRLWLARPFAHLTDLSMYIDADESLESRFICEQIHQLLIDAKELRRLAFVVDNTDVNEAPLIDEDHGEHQDDENYSGEACLFHATSVIWPKIEHLAISANVNATKFTNFLRLHSPTLKSLELRRTLVYNAPSLLEQIPKVLRLDHIYIKGLIHCGPGLPHEEDVDPILIDNAWLLSDGTEFGAPYEQSMKAYLLGQSPEMPDLLQDHLGAKGPEQRTDRIGTDPVSTVFYPSSYHDLDYVKLEHPVTENSP